MEPESRKIEIQRISVVTHSGKEFDMRNVIKESLKLSLTAAIISVLLGLTSAAAQNAMDSNSERREVLTNLGQRMQKRISVDFRNTPIDDVIRILSEQANVDIIKSPKVTGEVTATLKDVPLDEALNNILAANGYGYVTGKNMIRIAPASEIVDAPEPLTSRIYRINYADVKQVEEALKKFLSQRGSLSSNVGTSNIIVTDSESKIKAIDTFIEEIDRVTPQILVEARIYDISSKDRLDLGIEWEAGRNTTFTNGSVTTPPTAGQLSPFISGDFQGATAKTQNTTGTLRFGWLNDNINIDAVLKAQQEAVRAKLLANPRVTVLDNLPALFKIISEIPYQQLTESSGGGGGSVGTTGFREVGVTLKVTPHLTRGNMIKLHIQPEFSVKTGDVQVGTINNQFPQPVVDRREADTTMLVESGKTVVLGGLRRKDVSQQVNKVPLLGDIPLLGLLFQFHGEETINSELVVFITPKLVTNMALTSSEAENLKATEFGGPQQTSAMLDTSDKK